jgi:glycosyltransferase involved in cell wall biosynthesis
VAKACVIRLGNYPTDPRLHREVHALVDAGHSVDLICLQRAGHSDRERHGRLRVYRLPVPEATGTPLNYLVRYAAFFLAAAVLVTLLHLRRRYDLVQVESIPDALVFAAAIPRLLGARVVLDLNECMPEFFATRFGTRLEHRAVRGIAALEQASIRFADFALTCTEQMREAFVARGADPDKIGVILNSAEEEVFDVERHPPRGSDGDGFVIVCHGAVEERYGLDTAIRALGVLKDELPGVRLAIYGDGSSLEDLKRLAEDLGVAERVWFSEGFVPMPELLSGIARADAGLVAMKRDAFRDLTHCNKMFDFITMRQPVLMSRTRSVEAYFDESCFEFFESEDHEGLAAGIRRLHADPAHRERLVRRASEVVEPYRWTNQREIYLDLIDRVLQRPPRGRSAHAAVPPRAEMVRRTAILVTSAPGQPSVSELERQAAAGERPRKEYVELAKRLDADVIDSHYMAQRASPLSRLVARVGGMAAGQVVEGFLRRGRYDDMVAWADRIGLPLALLLKLARSRRRIVLMSVFITSRAKAVFFKPLRADSHMKAIAGRRLQKQIATQRLGVPPEKFHVEPTPVDDAFWRPLERAEEDQICAVGWEERDYATLIEAVRGLPVQLELAVGTISLPDSPDLSRRMSPSGRDDSEEAALPANVHLTSCSAPELRELYARSRFVVVPLNEVEFDAGGTALTEAMAMGKAVVTTRNPALADLFEDGEAGLFVAPRDPEALREAIARLLASPAEAARMGRAGRERVEAVHAFDRCIAGLAALVRGDTPDAAADSQRADGGA